MPAPTGSQQPSSHEGDSASLFAKGGSRGFWPALVYCTVSLLLVVHCFRYNGYQADTAEFVANVVALKTSDAVQIRDITYSAILKEAPPMVVPHILGHDLNTHEALVRRHKFQDPYTFAQFLPYFAIKPLYIEALRVANVLGFSLVRSIAAVSAASFLVTSVVLFLWVQRLKGSLWIATILLFAPELRETGQAVGPDALSLACIAIALYCMFNRRIFCSITLLMVSLWIRPETSILTILCLIYLVWKRDLPPWIGAVLVSFALIIPLAINHFGGSYGWKALYSHTFKFVEMEPGQFTPVFTWQDYLAALRSGLRTVANSSAIVFGVLLAMGYKYSRKMRPILILLGGYSVLHFLIYPNYEPRYFVAFYFVIAVTACAGMGQLKGCIFEADTN